MKGVKHSKEEKLVIVRDAKTGDIIDVAKKNKISPDTIKKWESELKPRKKIAPEASPVNHKTEYGVVQELREELSFWKEKFLEIYRKINS